MMAREGRREAGRVLMAALSRAEDPLRKCTFSDVGAGTGRSPGTALEKMPASWPELSALENVVAGVVTGFPRVAMGEGETSAKRLEEGATGS
jgi:hypothetical protein